MPLERGEAPPLVSVIIPTYNHGWFIRDALKSVWEQNYPSIEIIVVDDGSTDETRQLLADVLELKYVYQENLGLSAARNTGIHESSGELLLFLDADDWLLPGAIETCVDYLQQNESLAFVSGAHNKVYTVEGRTAFEGREINKNNYEYLLQGNYIGMHATVMYRKWVFEEFSFDVGLRACEDYDMYFKVARKFPVVHHTQAIAAYRLHSENMSGNIPFMLANTLKVLKRQQKYLRTASEKSAYRFGLKNWKDYYSTLLYKRLLSKKHPVTFSELGTLLKHKPYLALKFIVKNKDVIKSFLKKNLPSSGKRLLHKSGFFKSYLPDVGTVDSGDFSLQPFSIEFGYDRGGPVDRYYIESFLEKQSEHIKGRVLEIGDNAYTLAYGKEKVSQSDILHVDEKNTNATYIGDLSNAPHLPANTFDCIVLTQTLHLIYDFKEALVNCHRILKPRGVLLLTSPGITPIDYGEWKKTWYWSFTDKSLNRLLGEVFEGGIVETVAHGNVYVATAFLYGMGLPEVSKEKLDYHDPQYQVIITVKAVKASS